VDDRVAAEVIDGRDDSGEGRRFRGCRSDRLPSGFPVKGFSDRFGRGERHRIRFHPAAIIKAPA
jgi:hypothetical protein